MLVKRGINISNSKIWLSWLRKWDMWKVANGKILVIFLQGDKS